jgi:hypothetical protein
MKNRTVRSPLATAALVVAALAIGAPLSAQTPVRVSIPGTAFSPDGRGDKVVVTDVAGGRRFRGQAFSELTLRGVLRLPPANSALPKVQHLVIHFRTSPSGPSLRSVELRNGSNVEFRIETHLEGDYIARETATPTVVANAWAFAPRTVGSQTVLRLKIQFPGGFDSAVNPGEFFLSAVVAEFPGKAKTETKASSATSQQAAVSPLPVSPKGVIYALATNNDLLWYRHDGRDDGTFRWAAPAGKKVGSGWSFKQIFSGGDGVIYAITESGDLLWYRHDGRGDGTFRWAAPEGKKVGTGWDFKQVFSGGGGVIYAITADGDLLWYRHDGRDDGTFRWAAPEGKKVGTGWNFKQVFSGGEGVIYAVTAEDVLLWFRHDGRADGSFRWAAPEGKKVGTGWEFKHLFSPGGGVIYGITANNDLLWYRHDGRGDGSFRWAAPEGKKVGNGWSVKDIFCD